MTKNLSGTLEEMLADVRTICANSSDILINRITIGGISCALLGCEGMLSTAIMTDLIIRPLTETPPQKDSNHLFQHIQQHLLLSLDRPVVRNYDDLFCFLYSGFAVLLAEGQNIALAYGVQGYDKKSISEPSGEANLFGAHDGLTETVRTNMSLLRRRMKTPLLKFELSKAGKLSQTDICLCWLTDRVPPQLRFQIKKE